MTVQVLVADGSAAFGRLMKQALESIPGVVLAGVCRNGAAVLERIRSSAPDLVTMDLEMPGMNAVEALQAMRRAGLRTPVLIVAAAGAPGGSLAARALDLGALDLAVKPEDLDAEESAGLLRERLLPFISAAAHRIEVQAILRNKSAGRATPPAADVQDREAPQGAGKDRPAASRPVEEPTPAQRKVERASPKPAMVLIGVSTGGPEALARVIPGLPGNLRAPVLIVQHMPPSFTQNLADKLNSCAALPVKEAEDGETALPGRVYLAPGGKHLKVEAGAQRKIVLRTTADPPENNCRPAVDVLFRSAAEAFPGLSVAVILTGMGKDGTAGLRELRAHGVHSIAQDEASCTVFGMPKEAIQAGLVDVVSPLSSIASEIVRAVN